MNNSYLLIDDIVWWHVHKGIRTLIFCWTIENRWKKKKWYQFTENRWINAAERSLSLNFECRVRRSEIEFSTFRLITFIKSIHFLFAISKFAEFTKNVKLRPECDSKCDSWIQVCMYIEYNKSFDSHGMEIFLPFIRIQCGSLRYFFKCGVNNW